MDNYKCYIYKIEDKKYNKIVYIGQHKANNKYYFCSSTILIRYKKLFGIKKLKDRFNKEIIEYCDISEINKKEKHWIKHYDTFNNGLNLTEGGNTMSKCVIGKTYPQKNQKLKNRKYSIKTKYLMSIAKQGFKPSIKCHQNRINKMSKPVLQYDLEGNFIKEWSNGKQAANLLNIKSYGDISACCLNKQKSAHNFIWKYKENNNIILKIESKSPTNYPKNRKSKTNENKS